MNQNEIIKGLLVSLVIAFLFYVINDFRSKLEALEAMVYGNEIKHAQEHNAPTKTPCGCGGH